MMVLLTKIVSSADLKTSTLLAKRLILDASLGPEPASVDEYIAVLKTQTKICKDGRQVKMKSFYPVPFLENICSENFVQIIIKASVAEFIFIKLNAFSIFF